jgi:hypothetical protein
VILVVDASVVVTALVDGGPDGDWAGTAHPWPNADGSFETT